MPYKLLLVFLFDFSNFCQHHGLVKVVNWSCGNHFALVTASAKGKSVTV